MSVYHCDPNWPICLYDFTFKNLCPKYVAYRVEKELTSFLIQDHFYNINEIEAENDKLENANNVISD